MQFGETYKEKMAPQRVFLIFPRRLITGRFAFLQFVWRKYFYGGDVDDFGFTHVKFSEKNIW